jgi:hypothetical protein
VRQHGQPFIVSLDSQAHPILEEEVGEYCHDTFLSLQLRAGRGTGAGSTRTGEGVWR